MPVLEINFHVAGQNSLEFFAPDINCDLKVSLVRHGSNISYNVKGQHDGFPAYELYIERRRVYAYDPVAANADPLALFPPAEITVDVLGAITPASITI